MSYKHFTLEERKYLQQLLSEGLSFRKIAAILERSPFTISREVARNRAKYKPKGRTDNKYWYNHWRAQNLYICRRRQQTRTALQPGTEQWDYIVNNLQVYWTPKEIANRRNTDYPKRKQLCVSTIYRYIMLGKFEGITGKQYLRWRGKFMLPRNSCYNSIEPDRIIPQCPEEIRNRSRIGDWEGDTVYGGVGKYLSVSMLDRKSGYLRIGLLGKRTAESTRKVIEKLLHGLP